MGGLFQGVLAALQGLHMGLNALLSCSRALCDSSSAVVWDYIIIWCSFRWTWCCKSKEYRPGLTGDLSCYRFQAVEACCPL